MSAKQKLVIKGLDAEVAEKLIVAGLHSPKLIRAATETRVKEITGLSKTKVKALKAVFMA